MAVSNMHTSRGQLIEDDLFLGCILLLRHSYSPKASTAMSPRKDARLCSHFGRKHCPGSFRGRCSLVRQKIEGHPVVVLKVNKRPGAMEKWIVTVATLGTFGNTLLKDFYEQLESGRGPNDPYFRQSIPIYDGYHIEHPMLYLTNGQSFGKQAYLSYMERYCVTADMLGTFQGAALARLPWFMAHKRSLLKKPINAPLAELPLFSQNPQMCPITLRLNWPSYRLVMALFGDHRIRQILYEANTERHGGQSLANAYFASLRNLPNFVTWVWMTVNRFIG